MADYAIQWGNYQHTATFGVLPINTLSYGDILNSPGQLTGTIPLEPYPGRGTVGFNLDLFLEGATSLWVTRDGVPVWFGYLWAWEIDAGNGTLSFSAEGIHSFMRRVLLAGYTFNTDQNDITQTIVDYAAGLIAGVPGYTYSSTGATGVTREVVTPWWEWTTAADQIDKLAAMDNGFDWRWRYTTNPITGRYEAAFEFLYPAGGNDTGLVFDLDSNIASLRMTSDGKSLATQLIATGSGTGSETLLAGAIVNELIDLGYPALGTVVTHSDTNETAVLQTLVDRDARRLRVPNRQLAVEVYADTPPVVTDYQIGDIVRITANRGLLQLDQAQYRIVERTVDVDEGGNETVRLSLAPAGMF